MTLMNVPSPIKGSDVSVATSLSGTERVLAVRMSIGTSAAKTVAIPTSLIGTTSLVNLIDVSVASSVATGYVLAKRADGKYSPIALAGGGDMIRANNLSDVADVSASRVNIGLGPSGVSINTYGTSSLVPRFTVDQFGRITGVTNTTIETGTPNAFSKVSCSTSSVLASGSDTLNIHGTQEITTQIVGGILEIGHANSGVSAGTYGSAGTIPQIIVDAQGHISAITRVSAAGGGSITDAFTVVSCSSSSYSASGADKLQVHGGGLISTSITSNTLTIFQDPSGVSAGTYGSAGTVPQIIVNDRGIITSIARVSITGGSGLSNAVAFVSTSTSTFAASGADTLSMRGGTGVSTAIAGGILTIALRGSGASVGTYGTSSVIPQFTVDATGRITAISRVTISAQNAITMVSTSTSTFIATSAGDTLNIRGGTGVSTGIAGGILTIALRGSGASVGTYGTSSVIPQFTVDATGRITAITRTTISAQNAITMVSTSTSTFTATSAADVLNIRGGTGVSTGIAGGILTIALRGSGVSTASGTYGTSSIIPQITVDATGRITAVTRVTVPPFLSRVSCSTSTFSAVSANTGDTLNIRGGVGVSTAITTGILTISMRNTAASAGTYGTSSIIPQFTVDAQGRITSIDRVTVPPFFSKVSCSTSSVVAVSGASGDTLNMRGGTGIDIAIAGGILTITNTGGAGSGASTGLVVALAQGGIV